MTQRAGLRTTEPLTDLTERSVIGVTRARVTVETKSPVRCVRNSQPPAASGEMLLRKVSP